MSEIRSDLMSFSRIIVAPERGERPDCFSIDQGEYTLPIEKCPFCAGHEDMTPPEIYRIQNSDHPDQWQTRVVPNKYPLLRVETLLTREGTLFADTISGVGAHEVIIETPNHHLKPWEYTPTQLESVFAVICSRIDDLRRDSRIRYITAFKNYGTGAGATMEHPHSQIVGLPMFPPRIKSIFSRVRDYYDKKERCFFCDMIKFEMNEETRVICDNDDFVAFCPYSSWAPFLVAVYPKHHMHDITRMDSGIRKNFARILVELYRRFYEALGDVPLNAFLHTAPSFVKQLNHPEYWSNIEFDYHWHLELLPRITKVGGLELATGVSVNVVPPNQSAEFLRKL